MIWENKGIFILYKGTDMKYYLIIQIFKIG